MNTKIILDKLKRKECEDILRDIYVDENVIPHQTDRYIEAVKRFEDIYGECDVNIYSAPGRSEVCGNHTDHQRGRILAASVNLDAIAIVAESDDDMVRVVSDGYDMISIDIKELEKDQKEEGSTKALIKGVLVGAKQRGYQIGGFKAYVTSEVLIGAGLSSSAAFETLIATIISYMFNDGSLDAVTNAVIGQYAENVYFNKPCGLMDQMACSVGNLVYVDFDKPLDSAIEKIDFDLNRHGYSLCITDTKGSHADLTHEYAAIPDEMKKVAACFSKDVLRGITFEDILCKMDELREKAGDRAVLRAIHFINEDERVAKCVSALKNDDIDTFLDNIKDSGNSSFKFLQNVYCSKDTMHQNVSLALAVSEALLSDNGVCRVHGGGFAGTIQAFVKDSAVGSYLEGMDRVFGDGACKVLKIRKYGGIKLM